MKSKDNWNETHDRFIAWWKGDLHESPLISLITKRDTPRGALETVPQGQAGEHYFSDMPAVLANFRNSLRQRNFDLDSYPSLDLNFGPGSMALYLGSEPIFSPETVWFNPCVFEENGGWENFALKYDPNNHWWKEHLRIHKEAVEAAQGEFYVNIPDIVENMDILAAMYNSEALCLDLLENPDIIKKRLEELNELFFIYYDAFYDMLKDEKGGSSFTAFRIWGPGKTCKVQCDFNVLMSPAHFREFVCPTLADQCARLDNTIFHLDGPDAIRHAQALMEIPHLDGLQWTPGAAHPDGGDECWYPLYDIVHEAGKRLWVYLEDGDADTMVQKARKLVNRYGHKGLYINVLREFDEREADVIIKAAAKGFR